MHTLVVVRLRVVYGGWVGQVLPSYQNRQISALDETADAPQSSLFSFLSSLFSLLFSLLSFLSSSQFYQYLSLFSRFRSLPGVLPGAAPLIPWRIMNIPKRHSGPEKTTHSRAAPQFSQGKSVHSKVVHFCLFGISHFFQLKVFILECPSWRHFSIP